jgi:hypothetical protein
LRSRKSRLWWLLEKEWRELLAARSWWVLLLVSGPLIGVSFISAVRTYAELSGYGGTADGVGEAFSPLVGIWAPTFSACERWSASGRRRSAPASWRRRSCCRSLPSG